MVSVFRYNLVGGERMSKILLTFFIVTLAHAKSIKIRYHCGEIKIIDQKWAKEIFLKLPSPVEEFSYLGDHYYRYGKYFYCTVTSAGEFDCQIYLKGEGSGELSSYYKDVDFGKGSISEFVTTAPVIGFGNPQFEDGEFHLKITGKMAEMLNKKLFLLKEQDIEGGVMLGGKHLACWEKKGQFECRLRIPEDTFPKPPARPIMNA
jgi:hypothetical protein